MGILQRVLHPTEADFQRVQTESSSLKREVAHILNQVKIGGDSALLRYAKKFDSHSLNTFTVSPEEISSSVHLVEPSLQRAIERAKRNIEKFHASQRSVDEYVEVEDGVTCWRKSIPIERVGLYIPGGNAPLFSTVLMLAVPATLAGCKEIVLCTPPQKGKSIHPATLYAASLCGVTQIFSIGGAQAIGAMAYGTESVPKVDKIFGPGNRWVTEAKLQLSSTQCAIDMPAGPSEVMVVIDESSDRSYAAADLLSQAEHGEESQAMLVVYHPKKSEAESIVGEVETEIEKQLQTLSRSQFAKISLSHSKAFIVESREKLYDIINGYAPEHLLLQTSFNDDIASQIMHAGSVFIGPWACEAVGDYASGTNHTLPTGGWARSYGGVSLESFFKKVTFQSVTKEGLKSLGPTVETLALAEGLDAHASAVRVRLSSKEDKIE